MTTGRAPNHALRQLLAEAQWTGAQLARAVNAVAAGQHLTTRCDRSSVWHWLAGTVPRPALAALVAEALSRRLGRRVTPAQAGLTTAFGTDPGPALPARGDIAGRLERLAAVPAHHRNAGSQPFSPAAQDLPRWGPVTGLSPTPGQPFPTGTRGSGHPAGTHDPLVLFSRHDAAFGGGLVSEVIRVYLATSVASWLRQGTRQATRRHLLTTAAQLSYLSAFAHYDSDLHGTAQQYYLVSAALSREAGDRLGYALCARGMSVQALALGHPERADLLAESAVAIGLPCAPPHQRAFLLGQRAATRAALGDRHAARAHFGAAEEALGRDAPADTPVGAFHGGSLAFQRAAIARAEGDFRTEAHQLEMSLRHRPGREGRSRAVTTALLAEARLDQGHLDLACRAWRTFLASYPDLESARARRHLQTCVARLRPYGRNRSAAEVRDLARALQSGHRTP
ncbi:hypothetical protein [Streptomyces sp. NPDC097619]|uniref:hypothetical protein n=1 Tax=Streptomyces sp. NPDC097619 TaxID=3157228 RepID=UPI0033294798